MKQPYADLHSHTNYSDGKLTYEQLILSADAAGIGAIALTDHDRLMEGDPEDYSALTDGRVTVVRGVEISTTYQIRSTGRKIPVHVVALMYDANSPELEEVVRWNQTLDNSRHVKAVLTKLSDCGLDVPTYEALYQKLGRRVEKIDIAREICSRNDLTIDQAYDDYLSKKGRAFVPDDRDYAPMSWAVSAAIHSHGVPVIAHCLNYRLNDDELEELVADFRAAAQNFPAAIEVYYKNYNEEQCRKLSELAVRHNLLISCGSDYHGNGASDFLSHNFPIKIYETLKAAHDRAFPPLPEPPAPEFPADPITFLHSPKHGAKMFFQKMLPVLPITLLTHIMLSCFPVFFHITPPGVYIGPSLLTLLTALLSTIFFLCKPYG